jgi:hypothetical protein
MSQLSQVARTADSDYNIPLFGPIGRAAKMQKLCPAFFIAALKDYVKEEVGGLSQEELNVVAVNKA